MSRYHIDPKKLTLSGNQLLVTPVTRRELVSFRAASADATQSESAGYALIASHVTYADHTPLDLDEVPQADLIVLLREVMGLGKSASLPDFTNTP